MKQKNYYIVPEINFVSVHNAEQYGLMQNSNSGDIHNDDNGDVENPGDWDAKSWNIDDWNSDFE